MSVLYIATTVNGLEYVLQDGKVVAGPLESAATYSIKAVALTPDGRRAVSGSMDQTLRVWDLKRRKRAPYLQR